MTIIGGIEQSIIPQSDTCSSTDRFHPTHILVPMHCEGCGHVFPCSPVNRIGRCGLCRGRMLPGYSVTYLMVVDEIDKE